MLVVCIGDVLKLEVFRVHKGDVTQVEYTYSTNVCGNPKPVVLHFFYFIYVVGYERFGISGFVPEDLKIFCHRIIKC